MDSLGGAQGGTGWRFALRFSKRTLGDSRERSLSRPVNRANGALDALFSSGVFERVVCHYADEVMGWSSGECHWLALPQRIAKSWSVPNYREIISGIPPDSVTWSGGAVGNISCRGALNHGRRNSPDTTGEGLGFSVTRI